MKFVVPHRTQHCEPYCTFRIYRHLRQTIFVWRRPCIVVNYGSEEFFCIILFLFICLIICPGFYKIEMNSLHSLVTVWSSFSEISPLNTKIQIKKSAQGICIFFCKKIISEVPHIRNILNSWNDAIWGSKHFPASRDTLPKLKFSEKLIVSIQRRYF